MNYTELPNNYTPQPTCTACGFEGKIIYPTLIDRLFSIKGTWSMSKCVNSQCDLHWLNPSPNPDILSSFYSNYYTHTAEPKGGAGKRLYTEAIDGYLARRYGYSSPKTLVSKLGKWLIAAIPTLRDDAAARIFWLESLPKGRLLEVGFGNGATLARLKSVGWSVTGVEFDPVSVELAKSRNLDVRLGSLAECNFNDRSFDAVVASHLIEHLPNPRFYLVECARILKPGGKLVLTTPNVTSFGHRLFGSNWRGLEPPRHLQIFGPKSLKKIAQESGFKKVEVFTTARSGHIISESMRSAFKLNPAKRGRIEIELIALIFWFIALWRGPLTDEEIRLECER